MVRKGLDKIFVKRYWVGFKGTRDLDELVSADTPTEAIKKYMWGRGIESNSQGNIIVKRWKR